MTVPDPAASTDNVDQIAYWNSPVGERWAALQGRLDSLFAPLTSVALAFAAPTIGMRVVDIGCGTGATALALAQAVGPSGHVLGVDVSRPMLTVASTRLNTERVSHADVVLADASIHAFRAHTFDLAFSRFGVMFFADPAAAFANIRPALTEGGRLVFVCWQPLAANSWFSVPLDAIQPLLPPTPPADPLAPGPFAFSDPARVRQLLGDAGYQDIAVEPHEARMPLGPLDEAVSLLSQVGPASRALGQASPDVRPALMHALHSALAQHVGPDGVVLGGAVWLVSARPGSRN